MSTPARPCPDPTRHEPTTAIANDRGRGPALQSTIDDPPTVLQVTLDAELRAMQTIVDTFHHEGLADDEIERVLAWAFGRYGVAQ